MSGPVPVDWRTRFVMRDAGYLTPCREWTGGIAKKTGYGVVTIGGKQWLVHRLAWVDQRGDPGDLKVCHHCDNRPCFEFDHLFTGTYADNMRDAVAKERMNRGVDRPLAKLTDADVLAIRESQGISQRRLAAIYDVSQRAIWNVLHDKNWTHV